MRPRSIVKKDKIINKKRKNLRKSSKKPQKITKKDDLTPRRLRFCQEYVVDNNGSQAAIRAGYKVSNAAPTASFLLTLPNIQSKVEELQAKVVAKIDVSSEYVLKGIKELAERCMQEVSPILDKQGKPTGEYKFDSKGAAAAFRMLGEYKGMFKKIHSNDPDNPIVSGVVNIINLPSNGRELNSH